MFSGLPRRSGARDPERSMLPGRPDYGYGLAHTHEVLGTPLMGPFAPGIERLYVGMGCFWGAEKRFWPLPGVFTTAAGYAGGATPHPTYREVCTGLTGHAEMVMVAYDPQTLGTLDILRVFWENHDPTQGMRQGNDVGSQYRSAVYWTNAEQRDLVERSAAVYNEVLLAEGFEAITTEMAPAVDDGVWVRPFYYAEPHHQQYLAPTKNPHGYDCHAHTGILLPDLVT
jgi:peptide-methionine (S)-S-oxide reductase